MSWILESPLTTNSIGNFPAYGNIALKSEGTNAIISAEATFPLAEIFILSLSFK